MFTVRPIASLASASQRAHVVIASTSVSRRAIRTAPGRAPRLPRSSAEPSVSSTEFTPNASESSASSETSRSTSAGFEPTYGSPTEKPKSSSPTSKPTSTYKPIFSRATYVGQEIAHEDASGDGSGTGIAKTDRKSRKKSSTESTAIKVLPPLPTPARPLTAPTSPHLTFQFLPLTPTYLLLPALEAHSSLGPTDPSLQAPGAWDTHRIITRILKKGSLLSPQDRATYFASADATHRPPTMVDSSRDQKARDQVRSGKYDAEDRLGWAEWCERRRLMWEGRRAGVEGEKGVWYGSSEKERGKEVKKMKRDEERERREAEKRREVRVMDAAGMEEVWRDARGEELGQEEDEEDLGGFGIGR